MKLLIIKLSSMGDVIHAMPAITDLHNNIANIEIDWLVDNAFKEIPLLHGNVNEVFTINLRNLKKQPSLNNIKKITKVVKSLKLKKYDYVIDLQGLWKSAIIARYISGNCYGFARNSARDKWATICYKNKIVADQDQHAIVRLRELVAKSLKYDHKLLNYTNSNIVLSNNITNPYKNYKYLVFIANTTWATKEWPLQHWQELANKLTRRGYKVFFPWGNHQERNKVMSISKHISGAVVLPYLSITTLAAVLSGAKAVVAVDTGLAHLSAACNTPTIGLYGATSIAKSGSHGPKQHCLAKDLNCAPCLKRHCKYVEHDTEAVPCMLELSPDEVLQNLRSKCLI